MTALRLTGGGSGDRAAALLLWGLASLPLLFFAWLLSDLVASGLARIDWAFLTSASRDAGRAGGIAPMIVGSLAILGVCLAVVLPVGLAAAIRLAEYTRRADTRGALARRSLDILAGVPSIVFGLFGNALFCVMLGMGYSIAAGGLTLACMVLPLFVRATEASLRAVSNDLRQAGAALGLRRVTVLRRVLLPAAMPGIAVGLTLGIGRALAETAALLFTSGYVDRMPDSLLDSVRALSVHIFDLSMNVAGALPNAYGAALVLLALLLAINLVAVGATDLLSGRGNR